MTLLIPHPTYAQRIDISNAATRQLETAMRQLDKPGCAGQKMGVKCRFYTNKTKQSSTLAKTGLATITRAQDLYTTPTHLLAETELERCRAVPDR